MSPFALSFIHPLIMWGMGLASLPIIIHLLNRRRFKTMNWAAMEFLLKAAVRNRRRVRLENLLLLLLRTLLVVCLIAAVARPFSEKQNPLAALFGTEGATERVIVIDDSHSMRAGQGNKSAFDTAKQIAKRLVTRLHEERSSDRVTLVLGSRPRRGETGFNRVAVASSDYKKMLSSIDALRVSDLSFDVPEAVRAVADIYGDQKQRVVMHVVSDFRRKDWTDREGTPHKDIVDALGAFAKRGEVRFVDVGGSPAQNVGVIDLKPVDRAVIAGVPATFVATIRNHGPESVSDFSYWFTFGAVTPPNKRFDGTLEPGEQAEVKIEYTFRSAGQIVVSAHTRTDVLPGDDVRRRVVDVRGSMRFLLVDGEPEQEDFRGETDFLAAALMPPGKVESGVEVEVVSEYAFSGRELDEYDGVFLCNVYRLPEDRVTRLEEYVRAGGGLVFFLGDQVDPQVYNATFYGRGEEAGKKLLPLLLRDIEGSSDSYVNLGAESLDHPTVRFLRGMNQIVFRTVAVRRYVRAEAPARANTSVILHYTDDDNSPAYAEKSFGDGRVLMFTTAADLEWSNFPHSILYLALLQEVAKYIVKPARSDTTLTVGTPLVIPYDPNKIGTQVVIAPPIESGGSTVTLASEKERDATGKETKRLVYRYARTESAGIYEARLKTRDGEAFTRPYAFNLDPGEGDLTRAKLERVRDAVPGSRIERAGDDAAFDREDADKSEFWRTLVYALIAIAALETLLAWRFGHHATRRVEAEGKQVFVR